MPTWPVSLPQVPLAPGFSETVGEGRARFETETGQAKMRKRVTAVVDRFQVRFRLTLAQRTTLRGFIDTDTEGGSLAFDLPHPVDGGTVSVRFVTLPTFTPVSRGIRWDAAFELELIP
jgi:hypothetical protein